jgi:hypothetical protein
LLQVLAQCCLSPKWELTSLEDWEQLEDHRAIVEFWQELLP